MFGHKKGGFRPLFSCCVGCASEARAKANGETNYRVVQKHVDIELRRHIEYILKVDVSSSVDAEVQIVERVHHVKSDIIVAHKVLTTQ